MKKRQLTGSIGICSAVVIAVGLAAGHAAAQQIDVPVPDFTIAATESFEHQTSITFSADIVGLTFQGTVSGISGTAAWASDMRLDIVAPDGTTRSIGGFDNPGDEPWDFQGGGSTDDGTYSSVHTDLFDPSVDSEGQWTLTFTNDWADSTATMQWTDVTVGLLTKGAMLPGACCFGEGPDTCLPDLTEDECAAKGGDFLGAGSNCAICGFTVECPIDCPKDDLCPWDLTGSGSVGVPDLLALIGCWGTVTDPDCEQADFTGSGSVGVPDLLQMINNWGACPQGAGGGNDDAFCEPELCGENLNGGCNMDEPTWTPIEVGQTVCGTAWAQGGTRDTDWYLITLEEDSTVTWSVHAEFAAVAIILTADCSGFPNLDIFASAASPAGIPFEISADLPAGQWTLFVSTDGFDGLPCSENNNYTATATTEPTTVTAACCFGDGGCSELTSADCAAAGGSFAFPALQCADAICPGEACAAAVPVDVDGDPVTLDNTGNPTGTAPTCSGVSSSEATVWFEVIGDGTTLTASTCGSELDDVALAVFCSTCTAPLCVNASADGDLDCLTSPFQSSVSWCSEPGVEYWIAAFPPTGATQSEGEITLTVTSGNACTDFPLCEVLGACCDGTTCTDGVTEPQCDGIWLEGATCDQVGSCLAERNNFTCAQAFDVTGQINQGPFLVDNTNADPGPGHPDVPSGSPTCHWSANPDAIHFVVWFTFEAPASGAVNITTCPTEGVTDFVDTFIAVYQGTCGNLTEIGCAFDECSIGGQWLSDLTLTGLTPGQTYYMAIGNQGDWGGWAEGPFIIEMTD